MQRHLGRGRAQHIAILVRSLVGGGEQLRMLSLATAFATAGRTVDVYVTRPLDAEVELPPSVNVVALSEDAKASRRPVFLTRRQAFARALTEAIVRSPPDLLLSAGSDSALAIAVRAKFKLPQLLLVIRASSHPQRVIPWRHLRHRILESVRKRLRRRRYRAGDFIVAVSDDVAAGVHQIAPKVPLAVLPSPVITSKFIEDLAGPAPNHPWLNENIPVVLAAGRLSVAKDFPTLLRAFQLVRSRRRIRLVILGDGAAAYRQELVELARKLGIQNDVDLPGWVDDVPNWLARASLFVSTSIWEGSPGAIIEALSAGCPVVATDCPGDTKNLLHNGRLGGIAPVGDFRTLARLMENQLDCPLDSGSLKFAAEPYREEFAAAEYLKALDSLVESRIGND